MNQRRLRPHVLRAVAAIEGARLLRHPLIVLGLVASTALSAALFGDVAPVLHRDAPAVARLVAPMAAATMIAAQLAASRSRRDHTDAVFDAAPAHRTERTWGLLAALLAPSGLALLWGLAVLLVLALRGGIWAPDPLDVAAIAVSVFAAGTAGIAIGRWLPSAAAGFFGVLVLGIGMYYVSTKAAPLTRLQLWADWAPAPGELIELYPRSPGVHLAYVVAAGVILGAVALLRP